MGCNGWVGCDGWGAVVGLRCSAMVGDEGQVVQDLLLSAKGCGKEALSRGLDSGAWLTWHTVFLC